MPGLVCGPFAGAAGRSRDTRSKQEDPIRFRTLIDAGNLSYMAVSSRSGRSQDQEVHLHGGQFLARAHHE